MRFGSQEDNNNNFADLKLNTIPLNIIIIIQSFKLILEKGNRLVMLLHQNIIRKLVNVLMCVCCCYGCLSVWRHR